MKPILIGMAGPAGSGKDSAAKMLIDIAGGGKIISFASPLKAAMAAMGMPEPDDREAKEKNIPGFDFSWRKAAQTLGTEWGRGLQADLWIKLALKHRALEGLTVISDVRFVDEAVAIAMFGGVVIGLQGRSASMLGDTGKHASEAGVPDNYIHYKINNSHSFDFLKGNLALIYGELAK